MEISEAQRDAIDDMLEIADIANRQMTIAQVRIAAILGVSDDHDWVCDAVSGACDLEKLLTMTNTTVKETAE